MSVGTAIRKMLRVNIFLRPSKIAEVGHDDAAQRAGQITGGENAKRLHQTQPFRHVHGEKQLADNGSEEHED